MQIKGAVAIVTGAGAGIGRALAASFAAAGAKVVVADIDAEAAECTAEQITQQGHTAIRRQADVTVGTDIRALIDLAATEFGPVNIYVANAGIAGPLGLAISEDDWDHVLNVNLRAHIRAANVLVPGWVGRGGGYFVSIASATGLLNQIGAAAYAVSKHAAIGFAEWLAITHGDDGIGVSCVCPMGVNTTMLSTLRENRDPTAQLAASAIASAGELIEPESVADLTVQAVSAGRFMVLPHPRALDLYRQKGLDYDGWIAEMRSHQRSLISSTGAARDLGGEQRREVPM
jgi:NAD(P)-dependent dehydrogenase (short-subunit alcohol dehydrogenase family)